MSQPPGAQGPYVPPQTQGPYVPPGTQGPYVPPGTQGPYVPPGTPGQAQWQTQGMAPDRPSPPPTAPQRQPRSPRRWLAVVAIVAGLALIFGTTFLLGRLTAPGAATTAGSAPSAVVTTTPSPTAVTSTATTSGTPTKGFTFRGSSLIGSNYTATLPNGWVVRPSNGGQDDGEAEGPSGEITYWAGGTTRAATLCPNLATTAKAAATDVATDVTGVQWGGLSTVANDVVTKNKETGAPIAFTFYCADLPTGSTSVIMAVSTPANHSTHKKVVTQFLAGWVWR